MSLPTSNITYWSGGLNDQNSNKIFSQGGFDLLTNPSAVNVTGCFAIQSLTGFTFGATTGNLTDNLTGITIPAGIIIYGNFEAITGTGSLIAYGINS